MGEGRLTRIRHELAFLDGLVAQGHPDVRGIRAAQEDWILDECFVMMEGKMSMTATQAIQLQRSKRATLIAAHEEICNDARELMRSKNLDYASEADPFRNFRTFGRLGILVRLSDKLARLRSLLENGTAAVKGETERDTIVDIVNYAVLYDQYPKDETK